MFILGESNGTEFKKLLDVVIIIYLDLEGD